MFESQNFCNQSTIRVLIPKYHNKDKGPDLYSNLRPMSLMNLLNLKSHGSDLECNQPNVM